jgi:hypothetical protein
VLGSDIQDKVTIFISYLVNGGYKIIKYKKKNYSTLDLHYHETWHVWNNN